MHHHACSWQCAIVTQCMSGTLKTYIRPRLGWRLPAEGRSGLLVNHLRTHVHSGEAISRWCKCTR